MLRNKVYNRSRQLSRPTLPQPLDRSQSSFPCPRQPQTLAQSPDTLSPAVDKTQSTSPSVALKPHPLDRTDDMNSLPPPNVKDSSLPPGTQLSRPPLKPVAETRSEFTVGGSHGDGNDRSQATDGDEEREPDT